MLTITSTNGVLEKTAIEGAMRSLSTNVLTGPGSSEKKKVYPTNFSEAFAMTYEEEDDVSQEAIENMASWGDADARAVQSFEKDLEDLFQDIPDLHSALVSYHEAHARITERKRNRGFWPPGHKSSGKGYKPNFSGGGKSSRKGGSKGKDELLQRIARTHCKKWGELGHWKAECPNRPKDQVNLVTPEIINESSQVVFETLDSDEETQDRVEKACVTPTATSQSYAHAFAIQEAYNSIDPTGDLTAKMQQFFANRLKPVHFGRHRTQEPSKIRADLSQLHQ